VCGEAESKSDFTISDGKALSQPAIVQGETRTINQQEGSPFTVPEPAALHLLGLGAVCGVLFVMRHHCKEPITRAAA